MNILVISNSLIVKELFKKAAKKEDIEIEFQNSVFNAQEEGYSAIFIDDSTKNLEQEIDFIQDNFDYNHLIIIAQEENKYNYQTLTKPFLLDDIIELIEELKEENSEVEINSVLDINEIEKIKELMQLTEEPKAKEKKKKKSLKIKDILEEKKDIKLKNKELKKFLKKLSKADKKLINKLFDEATITLKIEFKD